MKNALGKHGRHLPRYRPGKQDEDQHNLNRAIRHNDEPTITNTTTAGGDKRQLRGIPVVGAGTGAVPGTNPVQALLDKEPDEAPRPPRQPLDKWLRGWIIDRDGATCYLCGLECWPHEIHIDHVIPVARGGDNHPSNLRVACKTCNTRKGAKMPDDPAPVLSRPKRPAMPTSGRPIQPQQVLMVREHDQRMSKARELGNIRVVNTRH